MEDVIDDALILALAVRLLLENRDADAHTELLRLSIVDPIGAPAISQETLPSDGGRYKRPAVKPAELAAVLMRDGWRCRYCGRRLVVPGVIELVGALCPEQFPFPAGHHMPAGRTHPAAIRMYPNVDHVEAGSVGGRWADDTNLVAACTPCNELKSDKGGWKVETPVIDEWDGLVGCYRALVSKAGTMRPYHQNWMRALCVHAESSDSRGVAGNR